MSETTFLCIVAGVLTGVLGAVLNIPLVATFFLGCLVALVIVAARA